MDSNTSPITISVVIPTRDRPALLRICLESVAHQHHTNLQVVVVDDGSKPEFAHQNELLLREICGAQSTYHYVDTAGAKGGGPAFARNVGIKLAQGRLIAFCDDDDYWTDGNHLSERIDLFYKDSKLDLVFAQQEARHDGKVTTAKHTANLPRSLELDSSGSCLLSKSECLLGWFPHMNVCMFRRELLEKIGGFWRTDCFEDLDLYVRAVDLARRVRYIDRTVAVHNNAAASRREAVTSSQLTQMDIKICATNVASHLINAVRSRAAIRYARRMAGDAYRWLATHAHGMEDRHSAAAFARLGLAAKFSAKWSLVTLYFCVAALAFREGHATES